MKLQELFGETTTRWAAYDEYQVLDCDGELYVTSAMSSTIRASDPITNAKDLIVDALNVGLRCVNHAHGGMKIEKAVLDFCSKYGLLGFMTALPSTPDFWEFDNVYLPKNPVIKDSVMKPTEYMKIFFPKEKEDLQFKKQKAMQFLLGDLLPEGSEPPLGIGDRETIKLMYLFSDMSFAQKSGFQRGYAEPIEWLKNQFRDWASMFLSTTMYYDEKDEAMRDLYRRSMTAYAGNAPQYKILLTDEKPIIRWDFPSLLQIIHFLLTLALTDDYKPLRLCKACEKVFYAQDARAIFCSRECKNRYNVAQSRRRTNNKEETQ
jgi:hypothetical protein